tara:strand:+ start:8793 stop:9218 length:426 start_codon:yes stop_codon:yes gene_type:complete
MLDKKTNIYIDDLIKKINDNNLSSIKISDKNNSIEITKNTQSNTQNINNVDTISKKIENIDSPSLISINSPMVGIIYITPKPSSPPFVKNGQNVKIGDTICLIEAMKTFNEIKSDKEGTIKNILVKNGEAVEFGQPLFEIS